jgi:hypothetical protein
MTAFTWRSCKRAFKSVLAFERVARGWAAACLFLACLLVAPARAEGIDLRNGALSLSGDGSAWVVTADFKMQLSPSVEEAVSKGLALYFVAEFELVRPRWYWRDERAIAMALKYRLSYHALTRQFRLTANGFQTSYASLGEALSVISRLRGWRIADADKIRSNENAEAWLRLRLDTSQLPKPFQVGAITNRDWNPESEWKRISISPETAKSAQ